MKLIKASRKALAISMMLTTLGASASTPLQLSAYEITQAELEALNSELAEAIKSKDTDVINDLLKAGDIETHLFLAGYHFKTGMESTKHIERSFHLVKAAASQGDKDAMLILADMYYNGIGTKVDYEEAFNIKLELIKPVATLEQSIFFSKLYLEGNSFISPNFDKAEFWLQHASNLGDLDSTIILAEHYELEGTNAPERLDILYRERAARMGHLESQRIAGISYFEAGMHTLALPWLRIASANGFADTRFIEGMIYLESNEVERDLIKAYITISDAAAMGSIDAKVMRKQIERSLNDEQFIHARNAVRTYMQNKML